MLTRITTVAQLELVAVTRMRWTRIFASAFALLSIATAWSAGVTAELNAPEGFAKTTVALVPLVLMLVPLAALLIGISGQSSDDGSEAYLFGQPVSRFEVVLGRFVGESLALGAALGVGFGAGLVFVGVNAGWSDTPRFLFFAAASMLLALVFLAVAALLAAAIPRRSAALAAGAFAWFFFALVYDALALSAAMWLTGRAGGQALMLSVFVNPTDLMRVLSLSVSGTPHILGPAGDAWELFLGGSLSAASIAIGALIAWTIVPLACARQAIARREL